jgi:hypothetical protein
MSSRVIGCSRAASRIAVAGVLLVPLTARADSDLPSQWRDGGVTSDPMSWAGVPFELEAGLEIGAVNDAEHLYVCLYPSNRRVQYQLLQGGATVWVLDEDGDKQGGVRFRPRPPAGEVLPTPPQGPRDAPEPSELQERAGRALLEFDILGKGGDVLETRPREPGGDLQLRVEASQHVYYVVRIPLGGESSPLVVGAEPGATIGLGVETPRLERPPGGGRRGPPPEEGGGDPEGPPPEGAQPFVPPDPIRFWTALSLALEADSVDASAP